MPFQILKNRKQYRSRLIFCGLLLTIFQFSAGAGTEVQLAHLDVPEVTALPHLDASPQDAAWASAGVISSLGLALNASAADIAPPATKVNVLWSLDYLYIRFVCDGAVYAPFSGANPKLYEGDVAEVFLDPVGDSRQWYEIEISPNGGLLEKNWLMTNPLEADQDHVLTPKALQGLWEDHAFTLNGLISAARITSTGWIADLAIPAAAILRRTGGREIAPGALRANFVRYQWPLVDGKRVMVPLNWSPVRKGCPHISPTAMGFLDLQAAHQ